MRIFLHAFAAASTATLVAGCSSTPDYEPPQVSMPAAFLSSNAIAEDARNAQSVDLVNWWRSFDDPLLAPLVERALEENLDIRQARARVLQARAALRHANAAMLPAGQVNGQAAESYQSRESVQGQIGSALPGYDREAQSYELNLAAAWELDVFGGRDASRDAARAEWEASAAAATAARLAVAAETAETYIAIRGLQQRIAVASQQAEVAQRLLGLVMMRLDNGLAADREVQQARGALANVRASVPQLEQELAITMNALDILLGLQPGSTRVDLATTSPVPVPPPVADAGGPAELLRRRPDIIASERMLAASHAGIGAAMSEYYPKFSLAGLLGTATMGIGGTFSGDAMQARGVLGLRWRLFDFGRVDAEIAAARGRNAEALAAYRLTVLRASQDVENAFASYLGQRDRAEILADGSSSLDRARSSSMAAYRGGVSSLVDVLDADRRLLENRDAEIRARTDLARAAVSSFRALGGGWDAAVPLAALQAGPLDEGARRARH